ncbi:MAG: DUF1566 domain-containing protein [Gammaproteobacteria bacterium]
MIWPSAGVAQNCNIDRPAARDSSRFDVNGNGTVTDLESGLTWQRCPVGQQWQHGACVGEAKLLTWSEALAMAKSASTKNAGVTSWRIPRLNEIAGIVDIRCKDPRIDLTVFPNTSAALFWTANNTPGDGSEVFTLSFGEQGVGRSAKSEKHYVRLVKGRN